MLRNFLCAIQSCAMISFSQDGSHKLISVFGTLSPRQPFYAGTKGYHCGVLVVLLLYPNRDD